MENKQNKITLSSEDNNTAEKERKMMGKQAATIKFNGQDAASQKINCQQYHRKVS